MEPRELMWRELIKDYGVAEEPGVVANPVIVGWFKELGYSEIDDDETAWCSLIINVMAKRLGLEYSGKLNARSWMSTGKATDTPHIGDVVVFWREQKTGWKGHVGLFAGYNKDRSKIFSLGGNQGNMLCLKSYPVAGMDCGLMGFRELNFL